MPHKALIVTERLQKRLLITNQDWSVWLTPKPERSPYITVCDFFGGNGKNNKSTRGSQDFKI